MTRAGCLDGYFLVRARPQHDEFVLSVAFKQRPSHHLLKKDEDGFYTVNGKHLGKFTSIPEVRNPNPRRSL